MSALELRRVIGVVTALAWPACRIFQTIFHPPWGTRLSDAMAPLVAITILALVATSRAAHRKHPEPRPRHARVPGLTMDLLHAHLSHLSVRLDRAESRQIRTEARLECGEARLACALQVINEANEAAGLPAPDMDDTMPGTRKLRAVPRLETQRETG